MAGVSGLSKSTVEKALDKMGDVATAELLGGGEVPLPYLGKLHTKDTAAREGRNPRTGATITIPAGRKVVFNIGKGLKEALR